MGTTVKNSKVAAFFKGVRTEFRKIIWPDRTTLLKQLAAVLVVTIITGIIIVLIDYGVEQLINFLTTL
ncbi:MAG: preprotein translocase subunit SecE [Eubacteriales bacterium]|nr:preprotein translocase subunit SecE [Eubacteriales bacterium]